MRRQIVRNVKLASRQVILQCTAVTLDQRQKGIDVGWSRHWESLPIKGESSLNEEKMFIIQAEKVVLLHSSRWAFMEHSLLAQKVWCGLHLQRVDLKWPCAGVVVTTVHKVHSLCQLPQPTSNWMEEHETCWSNLLKNIFMRGWNSELFKWLHVWKPIQPYIRYEAGLPWLASADSWYSI